MLFIIILLSTVLISLIIILVNKNKEIKKLKDCNLALESSKQTSLEYIDAIWQSQKNLVLDEKLKSMRHFIIRIAHLLNTPLGVTLTSISHLEDLLQSSDKLDIENAKEIAEVAMKNLGKSINIVNKITRLNGEHIDDEPSAVSVKDYLYLICDTERYQDTEVIIKEDFKINISQINLSIILRKVLDNAHHFKDSDESDHKVTLKATKSKKNLIIEVVDNGIGIDVNNIGKVFNPLYTTKNGTSSQGMGLAIAYYIITNYYSGEIKCSSQINKGTTFTLIFPNVVLN